MKTHKCRICKKDYLRSRSLQKVCSPVCAIALARNKREKAEKADRIEFKRNVRDNDKSYWMKKAQTAFNTFIRQRDKGLPCISCGKPDDGLHQRHASHYRPASVNSVHRFNPDNVWAGCAQCNTMKSGNLTGYRIELINKIGLSKVEALENSNQVKRWSIDELKDIVEQYKQKPR